MKLPFFYWLRKYLNTQVLTNTPPMKTALVIGHHAKDGGAYSEYLKMSEFNFYSMVSKKIKGVTIFEHNSNISGYTSRIKDTSKRLDDGNFDLVIECHFNSATPQANGCETLFYFKSAKGREYAQKFSNLVHNRTGIKLRNGGLKPLVSASDRGFASVFYPKAPVILIEPFFGSNESDCEMIGGVDNMASIIQEFVNGL